MINIELRSSSKKTKKEKIRYSPNIQINVCINNLLNDLEIIESSPFFSKNSKKFVYFKENKIDGSKFFGHYNIKKGDKIVVSDYELFSKKDKSQPNILTLIDNKKKENKKIEIMEEIDPSIKTDKDLFDSNEKEGKNTNKNELNLNEKGKNNNKIMKEIEISQKIHKNVNEENISKTPIFQNKKIRLIISISIAILIVLCLIIILLWYFIFRKTNDNIKNTPNISENLIIDLTYRVNETMFFINKRINNSTMAYNGNLENQLTETFTNFSITIAEEFTDIDYKIYYSAYLVILNMTTSNGTFSNLDASFDLFNSSSSSRNLKENEEVIDLSNKNFNEINISDYFDTSNFTAEQINNLTILLNLYL